RTDLVAIPMRDGHARVVAVGPDFASSPAVDPTDAGRVAWISWDHPRMPWDGTELHLATGAVGPGEHASHRVVAGGPDESIVQPG
ncbi:MAG: hypothetical protein KDA97_03495, partial [Acidimicrobiales bacterium]|nr:hypothetical protein [Acidimicrobiales bacterium]